MTLVKADIYIKLKAHINMHAEALVDIGLLTAIRADFCDAFKRHGMTPKYLVQIDMLDIYMRVYQ